MQLLHLTPYGPCEMPDVITCVHLSPADKTMFYFNREDIILQKIFSFGHCQNYGRGGGGLPMPGFVGPFFLAVQNSSIGDLVTH